MYRQSEIVEVQCRECGYHFFHSWNTIDDKIPLYCPECGARDIVVFGENAEEEEK